MNVGDYVRTKKGIITKIEKCKNGTSDKLTTKETGIILDLENWFKDDCVKSRANIIDLIEVGDIITYKTDIGTIRVQDVHNSVVMAMIKSGEIEVLSIVTKEMFANAEYRVETN